MTRLSLPALLTALVMGLGLPASAQETTTPPAPAAPATTPQPPAIAQTAAQAEVGQPYWGPTNGDWKSRCFKSPEGDDPCEAFQVLTDGTLTAAGQLNQVAEFSLFDLPDGNQAVLGGVIIAPLETDLQSGLAIQIDGATPKLYPYSFCTLAGCIARIGFTESDVAELKKGKEAKMIMVPAVAPDQKVEIKVSLTGVTAAIVALPKVPDAAKP